MGCIHQTRKAILDENMLKVWGTGVVSEEGGNELTL